MTLPPLRLHAHGALRAFFVSGELGGSIIAKGGPRAGEEEEKTLQAAHRSDGESVRAAGTGLSEGQAARAHHPATLSWSVQGLVMHVFPIARVLARATCP